MIPSQACSTAAIAVDSLTATMRIQPSVLSACAPPIVGGAEPVRAPDEEPLTELQARARAAVDDEQIARCRTGARATCPGRR